MESVYYKTRKAKKEYTNQVIWLALIAASAAFFYLIRNVVFTVDDDFSHYLYMMNDQVGPCAISGAEMQGRIENYILSYFACYAFAPNSLFLYKLFSTIGVLFSVWCMWFLLERHLDKRLAYAAAIFFIGAAYVDGQHNLFVSYILTHQISMGLIMLSIEQALTYYKKKKKRNMVFSAIFLLISLFCYEAFFLFCMVSFGIAFYFEMKENGKSFIKSFLYSMRDLLCHIVLAAAYLAVYMAYRMMHPSVYDGNSVGASNIGHALRTLFTYAIGFAPFNKYVHDIYSFGFGNMIKAISPISIVVGFVVAIGFVAAIRKAKELDKEKVIFTLIVAFVSTLIPCVLVSVTAKYQMWVVEADSYAYVPSYYSYFALVIVITCLTVLIYQKLPLDGLKNAFLALCGLVAFLCVLTSQASTRKYITDFNDQQLALKNCFDNAFSSDEFLNTAKDGDVLYVPGSISFNGDLNAMNSISGMYSHNVYEITDDYSKIDFSKNVYELFYDYDTRSLKFGKLDKNGRFVTSQTFDEYGKGNINKLTGHIRQ